MISTSELRLGNWVLFKPDNSQQVIDHVCLSGTIGLQGNAVLNTDQLIDPIPLTPEVLVKCGFEWRPNIHRWVHMGTNVPLIEDARGFYLGVGDGTFGMVIIQSVHHLQNIIYGLIGTELKYQI